MPTLSRFQKEQALKAAGVLVPPYPVAKPEPDPADQPAADRAFLAAGTAWEHEVDRLYLQLLMTKPEEGADESIHDFVSVCETQGLAAALEQLNSRVTHRFTAVYRLEGELLRNVELVDKAREARPEYLAEVPMDTSFCQFVLRDGMFMTSNSGGDDRLDGHPYKGVMVAYHGVPIPGRNGSLFGTLCHFDVQEQPLSDTEFAHLRNVARVLPSFLK